MLKQPVDVQPVLGGLQRQQVGQLGSGLPQLQAANSFVGSATAPMNASVFRERLPIKLRRPVTLLRNWSINESPSYVSESYDLTSGNVKRKSWNITVGFPEMSIV